MLTPNFVNKSVVLKIHQRQVEKFGGTAGVRDEGLLESALAQPQATFFGEYLHPTIYEQAAAYLFHIAKNHPFIDGNKRTAFAVMDTFLRLNGYDLNMGNEEIYNLVMQVAQGNMNKAEIANYLEQNVIKDT
ncbi:type II toxin-antitoxin system death-on-curing family toxin [Rivularia sp. UHCC 0363]|uniref:type II toxin-antitoxin system death-on-curing family toxin n=1 Tax=Rivularia sp. UHCC 0363 TaxID=3110244 RepID=UPI002B21D382|nr:type II toxin-antitoxin system death-on-curing family toxin [Rivularia sp. UHCC 0363]MEA5595578.1 type II toxin-antitoxin system death-on-curing family toxin [Rivularia sp. UHCC 0363]